MTYAELHAGEHRALRYFTDPRPRAGQVEGLALMASRHVA